MKEIENKKEMKPFLKTTSQYVDEADNMLMLIREKLQEFKDQEEEQQQFISSGKDLRSSAFSINEANQSLTDALTKLEELGRSDNISQTSSSLAEGRANLEKKESLTLNSLANFLSLG